MRIIEDLYETIIIPTTTNVKINSTISITVKLIDFNGDIVNRNDVLIECDKGHFSNNNDFYISDTVNGVFTVEYTASEYGVANINCNNTSIQLKVDGLKLYKVKSWNASDTALTGKIYNLFVNPYERYCRLSVACDSMTISASQNIGSRIVLEWLDIPSEFLPLNDIRIPLYRSDCTLTLGFDSGLYIRFISVPSRPTSIGNSTNTFEWTY